jgi:hypothetical protein
MENTNGYALVDSKGFAFSWHPSIEDAQMNAAWQAKFGHGTFRIVKDVEATWPDVCA